MKVQLLEATGPVEGRQLRLVDRPVPVPAAGEILVRVSVCGVCHTELDEIEGRLMPRLPIVPGHQVVGHVADAGAGASRFKRGDRVGIAWIHRACGHCARCRAGAENLCAEALWTGKDVDGGYAEYTLVSEQFAYPIPRRFSDAEAAPLLCAGVIGYRALRLAGLAPGETIALFGFGASAHIVIQIVRHRYPGSRILVFTRGAQHRDLARRLGADWAGQPGDVAPSGFDRAIDFTPIGSTVRDALALMEPGGRLVINAIRKRDLIPALDYATHLWHEKTIQSVANVTRRDAEEFLPLAAEIPIVPEVRMFGLAEANDALIMQKQGAMPAAAVLKVS